MRRWTAYAAAAIASVAVLAPAVRDRDGFPLSTYPMFSYDRGRVADIDTAVGIDRDGRTRRLSPELIAGGSEVIHAAATVSKSISRGDSLELCGEIAARARERDFASIEVVTERYDVIDWFDGDEQPINVTVHAHCEVGS
jgi:hypothetical protein